MVRHYGPRALHRRAIGRAGCVKVDQVVLQAASSDRGDRAAQ